jgi:hypothetical protein
MSLNAIKSTSSLAIMVRSTYDTNDIFNLQKRQTPWIDIFTSLPMWAVVIAHCGQNWGFWTLLTEMPSYMNSILKFDLKSVSYSFQF